jgi:hypothetical protein
MRRVLLDENLPRLLKRELPHFDVHTVAETGWAGTQNGALLRLAETQFDVFVTADRNLPHQQVLSNFRLGMVVIVARSTKLEDLRPLAPELRKAIKEVKTGETCYIGLV